MKLIMINGNTYFEKNVCKTSYVRQIILYFSYSILYVGTYTENKLPNVLIKI